jgi:hypothetical protein
MAWHTVSVVSNLVLTKNSTFLLVFMRDNLKMECSMERVTPTKKFTINLGRFSFSDGTFYIGDVKNGTIIGVGKWVDPSRGIEYEGSFVNFHVFYFCTHFRSEKWIWNRNYSEYEIRWELD